MAEYKLVPDSVMNYETTAGAPGTKVSGERPDTGDYKADEIGRNIRAAKARDEAAARAEKEALQKKAGVNKGEIKPWYDFFK